MSIKNKKENKIMKNKIGSRVKIQQEGCNDYCIIQWDGKNNHFGCTHFKEDGSNVMYNITKETLIEILKGEQKQ